VLASYARTGRRAEKPSKADLEKAVAEMRELVEQLKTAQLKEKILKLKDQLIATDFSTASKPPQKRIKRS
jgi:signal transduction histidine kinase